MTLWAAPDANKSILICDPDLLQSQSLLKKLKKAGLEFERTVHSGSLEVIADLTAHGGGVGILPSRVATRAQKKISRVPKAPVFYDEHCLIYRAENRNVKSIQALNAAIRGAFGKDSVKNAA